MYPLKEYIRRIYQKNTLKEYIRRIHQKIILYLLFFNKHMEYMYDNYYIKYIFDKISNFTKHTTP